MAKLYITEFRVTGPDHTGRDTGLPLMPPIADYSIEIGSESKVSQPFSPKTHIVVVSGEMDCSLAWGKDPVATEDAGKLFSGMERWVSVNPGDRLAVIVNEGEL